MHVELLMKELVELTNVAEAKTMECLAMIHEREYIARMLENAKEETPKYAENETDVKKSHPEEAGNCQRTEPFQSSSKSF